MSVSDDIADINAVPSAEQAKHIEYLLNNPRQLRAWAEGRAHKALRAARDSRGNPDVLDKWARDMDIEDVLKLVEALYLVMDELERVQGQPRNHERLAQCDECEQVFYEEQLEKCDVGDGGRMCPRCYLDCE